MKIVKMVKCSHCDKFVKNVERKSCTQCLQPFHAKCVGLEGSSEDSKTWKCMNCKPTGVPSTGQLDIAKQLSDLRAYLDDKLESIKSTILDDITGKIIKIEGSVNQICSQHSALLDRITNLEDTLATARNTLKTQDKAIQALKNEMSTVLTKMSSCEEERALLSSKIPDIDFLKQNVNEVEQRARLHNLEIFGIPEQKTEDLAALVLKIAVAVGVTVTVDDLEFVTRVPSRIRTPGLPKTVVARFKSLKLRDALLSAARKTRGLVSTDLDIHGEAKKIFINEHLTPSNKALLKAARAKCNELGFQHIWTRNAKIYIRKQDKARAYRITNLQQVYDLAKKS